MVKVPRFVIQVLVGYCGIIWTFFSLQLHPGTSIYITDRFSGWSSLEPMWHQVEEMGADLLSISADHPEGVNLIGESFNLMFGKCHILRRNLAM